MSPRRSARQAAAPKKAAEEATRQQASKKGDKGQVKKPAAPRQSKKAKKSSIKWDLAQLTSPDSVLVNVRNLKDVFKDILAVWSLTADQKDALAALLPAYIPGPGEASGDEPTVGARLSKLATVSESFKADVAMFQEDLACGLLDPRWLKQAEAASIARAKGEYDDWKEEAMEEWWGQKLETSG